MSVHRGSAAPRRPAARARAARHGSSLASRSSAAARAGTSPGVEDHSLDSVADEVGQVAGPPPDDRQAGGQCLAVDRAVRFPPAGQHEDVGAGVEAGDAVPVEHAVVHDPVAEDGDAAPDSLGVGRLDVVPAGEVESDPVVGEAAQCVEQLQRPLAGHPVADADGRGPAAVSQVGHRAVRQGRHVAPGRDDPDAVGGQPVRRGDEFLAQRLAGRDQQPAAAVQVPVEHGLGPSPRSAVVDATRRLVENRGKGATTIGGPPSPWRDEPGGDAVDQHDVAVGPGEGVGPRPHGHELDLGAVVTRQFGQAAVVEVAAAELLGRSEGEKGDEHAGPPRRPDSLRPRRTVRWR